MAAPHAAAVAALTRTGGESSCGNARGILSDLSAQALELAAAHVGEILAIGTRCRALVEKDRNLQLSAHAIA